MPKPMRQREIEIVMAVDRDTGVLDLRVYDHHPKKRSAGKSALPPCGWKICGSAADADRTASDRGPAHRGRGCRKKVEETESCKCLTLLFYIDDCQGRISECRQDLDDESDI